MMNYKWELFKVGMQRAEWVSHPQGMVTEWNDISGLTLFVFYESPSNKEIEDMSAKSRFEIAFKDVDGVGFFAVKFGEQPWGDCSFSPNLYPVRPQFEKPQKGQTYAVHIMLVDVFAGELKMIRTIALGAEFAEHFRLWCLKSLEKNIGRLHYNRVIDKVFVDYPTPESLAMDADVRWICPHGEDEQKREEQQRE